MSHQPPANPSRRRVLWHLGVAAVSAGQCSGNAALVAVHDAVSPPEALLTITVVR